MCQIERAFFHTPDDRFCSGRRVRLCIRSGTLLCEGEAVEMVRGRSGLPHTSAERANMRDGGGLSFLFREGSFFELQRLRVSGALAPEAA